MASIPKAIVHCFLPTANFFIFGATFSFQQQAIMAIQYYLLPNPVSSDPDAHYARVDHHQNYDGSDVVREMLHRGTTFSRPDLLGAIELFTDVVSDLVARGNRVNLPLANFGPVIKGTFDGATDSFDADRHALYPSISAGTRLHAGLRKASMEKVLRPLPKPIVSYLRDTATGQVNGQLTPGNIAVIKGRALGFDQAQPDEGVFFIHSSGTATRVSEIGSHYDREIICLIPPGLAAGDYTLEVRSAFTQARHIRTGRLLATLTLP